VRVVRGEKATKNHKAGLIKEDTIELGEKNPLIEQERSELEGKGQSGESNKELSVGIPVTKTPAGQINSPGVGIRLGTCQKQRGGER